MCVYAVPLRGAASHTPHPTPPADIQRTINPIHAGVRHPTPPESNMTDQTTQPLPSAVKLHHVPNWLKVRIRERVGRGYDLHDVMIRNDDDGFWLDHWGSTKLANGQEAFVSEPYGLNGRGMAGLLRTSEALNLHVSVHAASEWNPSGGTIRILLTPKESKR